MWKRNVLNESSQAHAVAEALQPVLTHLIHLGLIAKQAHWAVFGRNFLSVHEKLDEVADTARTGADEVAERIAKLGICPDGRLKTVEASSGLVEYPREFQEDGKTLGLVCDALKKMCDCLREARQAVEDQDPYSEDMVIGIGRQMEEHLWMLQAMEGHSPNDRGGAGPSPAKQHATASR